MTDNSNAPDKYSRTLTYRAALKGDIEIVKTFCPLRDNPTSPNEEGFTPIVVAAFHGHIGNCQNLGSFGRQCKCFK